MTNTEDIEGLIKKYLPRTGGLIPVCKINEENTLCFTYHEEAGRLAQALESQRITLELFRAEVKSNVKAMEAAKAKILTQQEEIASLKEDSVRVCHRETELLEEVNSLRGLLGNSSKDCPYCGLPAKDQARCKHGFPGCSRADDQMLGEYFAVGYANEQLTKERGRMRKALEKYGTHISGCASYELNVGYSAEDGNDFQECNCGFNEALQGTPELPKRTLRKSASVTDEQRKKAYDAAIVSPEGGCEHGRDMTEYCLECGRVNGRE